jgi:peptidoglycan hydrolase-like protein with peptidoglycan-binding domain
MIVWRYGSRETGGIQVPLTLPRFINVEQFRRAAENNPPLSFGSRGEGVQAMQLALVELGFAMPMSTGGGTTLPDGIFGSETKSIVQAFQRANMLTVDGVAGRQTLERLDALVSLQSKARAVSEAKPVPRRSFV